MKQWFPFTDYDFYAYLTSGMLAIVAVDYTLAGSVLVHKADWQVVDFVFWAATAYVVGQLLAGPSAALLEHWITRKVLAPPAAILLGFAAPRWREGACRRLFANFEYRPLSEELRQKVIGCATAALGVAPTGTESVFFAAYPVARTSADTAGRLDHFRNLYGFSRNLAFVGIVAVVLLVVKLVREPSSETGWLLLAAAMLSVGMYGRFLKFYSAFAAEVFRAFASIAGAKK